MTLPLFHIFTKRELLVCFIVLSAIRTSSFAQEIALSWCGEAPSEISGQSWGVPFSPGEIGKQAVLGLKDASGNIAPVQQWTMARWGDGSPKWIGFAAVVDSTADKQLIVLSKTQKKAIKQSDLSIKCSETDSSLTIDNGLLYGEFSKGGHCFIKKICICDKTIAENGSLQLSLENRSQAANNIISYQSFQAEIKEIVWEQDGPVRACLKISGQYAPEHFPYCIRLYFYAGCLQIRLVHSFVYDGNEQQDFIKALGIRFEVPFREEIHNRHIRFSGDEENSGIWSEPVQPLTGRRILRPISSVEQRSGDYPVKQASRQNTPPPSGTMPSVNYYRQQLDGERIPDKADFDKSGQALMNDWASWNDYKLTQLSADGFAIQKRTGSQSPWIFADGGQRASGMVSVGDVSGGLSVVLKDCWQSYPVSLEINDAKSDRAKLTVWLWSPEAEAMDLRHYDTLPHGLNASYEDIQQGMSTPCGIARTHELTLIPYADSLPTREQMAKYTADCIEPAHLLPAPEYLHTKKAFGRWSLPYTGRYNDTLRWIETQLDDAISFYQSAIRDNRWYGFWNYGDVMHSYDRERHAWLYDVGGFAWDNTELAPEMWLWYSFLRSGRYDIFKMAEAMSRHTAEVDAYHLGSMKGLGSRHNVSHWGCGAKEVRIAQAAWKRFYYYLTTDERMSDLMHEVADADSALMLYDPLRIAKPRSRFPSSAPTRLRWGPDWTSLAGNWFTEWERTGDTRYLNKLKTGFDCLSALPDGLFTGKGPLGYYPESGKIIYEGPKGACDSTNHLATIMGGFEMLSEMIDAIDHPAFKQCWIDYCLYYSLPHNDSIRTERTQRWGNVTTFNTPRLTAYAAWALQNNTTAQRAWQEFMRNSTLQPIFATKTLEPPSVLHAKKENPFISTNGTSQWCLNAIIIPELLNNNNHEK